MTSEAAEEDLEVSGLKLDVNDNDDEQIRIEAWLDEHPEFFQEYLIRKGMKLLVPTYFNIVVHQLGISHSKANHDKSFLYEV